MPTVSTGTHRITVRHCPQLAGHLEMSLRPDWPMPLARLNRNDAMILSDLLQQVASELPQQPDPGEQT